MSDERKEPTYVSLDEIPDEPVEGLDQDADPFAGPPPPNDGVHIFRAVFLDITKPFVMRTNDEGKLIGISIPLKLKVEDEGDESNGLVCFDRMVSTKANAQGASRAAGVIRALGERPERTHRGMADQLWRLIGTQGVLVKAKTHWEARQAIQEDDEWKDKFKLSGQRNFPKLANGKTKHVVESGYDGQDVAAQGVVDSYVPLGS